MSVKYWQKIKNKLSRRPIILGLGALCFLLVVFIGFYGFGLYSSSPLAYPELSDIKNNQSSFQELSDYLKTIAQKKGAIYAYDILRKANLPPQSDIHLLGHVVGDELYKQLGKGAIEHCTQEFRNACSHTVVVGLMLDFGLHALDDINEACKKAPGGLGAYTMCFHGLGHGVLAYEGYDLKKTIDVCGTLGTKEYGNQEIGQCVSGAVMEMISGGGHDQKQWALMRPKYILTKDPLAPCNQAYMPANAKLLCYAYLTPHLFEAAGASLSRPDPSSFPKALSFCDALPKSDPNHDVCISSFGKEFINLARTSDLRDITTVREDELARMYEWCGSTRNAHNTQLCNQSVLQSMYWGGENNPSTSVRFCSYVATQNKEDGNACYKHLATIVKQYAPPGSPLRQARCDLLPKNFTDACSNR